MFDNYNSRLILYSETQLEYYLLLQVTYNTLIVTKLYMHSTITNINNNKIMIELKFTYCLCKLAYPLKKSKAHYK